MNFKNLSGLAAMALVLPLFANGCNELTSVADAACCSEYVPGTDMSKAKFGIDDVKVAGQFNASMQGAGDLVSLADTLIGDVTNACRNIAVDLGATAEQRATNDKLDAPAQVTAWCNLAVSLFPRDFRVDAKLDAEVKCEASIQANVDCKANCDVNAQCDLKLNPPICTGGELSIDCKGGCTAEGSAPSIACEGSCSAVCEGSCSVTGSAATVTCDGTCNGNCAAGGAAAGSGIQADGSCKGTCSGTCTARPGTVSARCEGKCEGRCTGSCTATPGSLSVKCSGKCNADFTPIECKGGTLSGGCKVEASCEGSCNASAQAKASCTPPRISFAVAADPRLQAVLDTLSKNLPDLLIAIQARGNAFKDLVQTFGGGIEGSISGKIGASGTACLLRVLPSLKVAGDNVAASLEGAVKVTSVVTFK
jgi:hypothetical protein